MSTWDMAAVLSSLHTDIQTGLSAAKGVIGHPGTKGDASEAIWLGLLNNYLPERYRATKAFVADSNGKFSQQIDIVIHDRQYTPFIWRFHGSEIVPAESVYAVFEAKQDISSQNIKYAVEKIKSVRALYRTSLPIPHAGGIYPAKSLPWITGGILSLRSEWKPPLGDSMIRALNDGSILDIGCVAEYGYFLRDNTNEYSIMETDKAATAFLFELIAILQEKATVPMIDIRAYGKWL